MYTSLALVSAVVFLAIGHGQAFEMRWCTISDKETSKCNAFKAVVPTLAQATSLTVSFKCVAGTGAVDCMEKIQQGAADLITLDGGEIYMAGKTYSMVPIVGEDYEIGTPTTSYFAVAVAKKNNPGINFKNLKGKKSCHTGAGKTAGWNVPVGLLLSKNIMATDKSCSAYVAAGKFFNESCVPNVKLQKYGSNNPGNLCALCPDECTKAGNYSGYSGAFKCLKDGLGDVAFVKHTTVPLAEANDYQYLCKDGRRADNYTNCYLDKVPSHAVMTKTGGVNIANFKKILIKASETYGITQTNPNTFQLFESMKYMNGSDLLFKDSTKNLVDVGDKDTYKKWLGDDYLADIEALTACPSTTSTPSTPKPAPTAGSKNIKPHLLAAMFSFIALLFSGALLK